MEYLAEHLDKKESKCSAESNQRGGLEERDERNKYDMLREKRRGSSGKQNANKP